MSPHLKDIAIVSRLTATILSNLNRFLKIAGRFFGKFVVKRIFKMPPHLAYVATLPCDYLTHFLRLLVVCWPGVQSA